MNTQRDNIAFRALLIIDLH